MIRFFQLQSFITYWLDAVDEHSLHSPFLYDFYTKIVKVAPNPAQYKSFENLREKLIHSSQTIEVNDLGSGSSQKPRIRKVSDIAIRSLSPSHWSALYHRIAKHFQCKIIIELGTSFGINSLYLAHHKKASVTTFEGSPAIADIAESTFEFAEASNIKLMPGNINSTLPLFLQRISKFDLAFVDANHRYAATLKYFNWLAPKTHAKTILIFDDIHHSREMENAWQEMKKHELVYASADLYRCGILFFDPSLNKQHVILQS